MTGQAIKQDVLLNKTMLLYRKPKHFKVKMFICFLVPIMFQNFQHRLILTEKKLLS